MHHFNLIFNLSHFKGTIHESNAITILLSPELPLLASVAVRGSLPEHGCEVVPAAASVWTKPKFFIFGKMLRFPCTQEKCACYFLVLFYKGWACICSYQFCIPENVCCFLTKRGKEKKKAHTCEKTKQKEPQWVAT